MIIKFCGIRRPEDIEAVNETRPDLAGFIIVKDRRRYISPEKVCELRQKLNHSIKVVGVFIDEDIEVVAKLLHDGIIDIAQLHGNESEDYIRELKSRTGAQIIKAVGIRSSEDVERAERSPADLVIVDSPGGGTGNTFDWELLKKIKRPYILAGGINAENIEEAVEMLHPYGVDVSSGIETDGYKDKEKMKAFMALVKKGR
ncbi:phosphoribosylanthranilate isomerase [Ruminococcaceae bacterium KH2T8]|nr:phosphoribosylanthranilate isomerase [Ruminococcaceae bacterium KH2T8]